jgi:hypothetical protein
MKVSSIFAPAVLENLSPDLIDVVPKSEEVRAGASNLTVIHIRHCLGSYLDHKSSKLSTDKKFVANMLPVTLRRPRMTCRTSK